ncbi:hypothetical protein [Nocardioides sp. P5_E3]
MGDKTVEDVRVEVDGLALAIRGWQVEEMRARLVTQARGDGEFRQQVVVAGRLRFQPEQWSDRFAPDEWASIPLLALSLAGAPSSHRPLLIETALDAGKRPRGVSEASTPWYCRVPLTSADFTLLVTAYDWQEIDSRLELPTTDNVTLPVEVIDETSRDAIRLRPRIVTGHVCGGDDGDELRVVVEGTAEFGNVAELLATYLDDEAAHRDPDSTLEAVAPFEVAAPELEIEVLDETGFLLERREHTFYGYVAVGKAGSLPRRQPQWIAEMSGALNAYAGVPARLIVRIVDPLFR